MPPNPSNIMNNDLAIGGNFGAVGNIVTAAGVGASNEVVSYTGLKIASGTPGNPTNGDLTITIVEQLVTLNTSSTTTTVTLPAGTLPLRAVFMGATMRVTADILTDCDTLTLTTLSPPFLVPLLLTTSPFTVGNTIEAAFPGSNPPTRIQPAGVDEFELRLSGGGGSPPTSGTVRVVLYVANVGALTS